MDEQQFIDLVTKKLSGGIRPKDALLLDSFLKENLEHQQAFVKLKLQWEASGNLKLAYQPDVQAAWTKFKGLKKDRKVKVVRIWSVLSKIAAVLAVAIGLALYFLNDDIGITYSTAENENREVKLPDGTHIFLRESTILTLAKDFGESERSLSLEGEAYFKVARDKNRPFKISSAGTLTEVLGTSFNVRSRPDEHQVLVNVVSGSVSFSMEDKKLILTKNRSAIYDNTSHQLTELISGQNHLARFTQKLVFDNNNMGEVIESLQDYFEVSIMIETPNLENCLFTGSFEKPALEEVLKVIALSLNIEYKNLNNSYLISGTGCTK